MRYPLLILVLLSLVAGCDRPAPPATAAATRPVPAYTPEAFRRDITALIDAKDYAGAVSYVQAADVDRQLKHDRGGHLAIGVDKIYLPGLSQLSEYDPSRDWYMPGTSDALEPEAFGWQAAATEFAERYNRRRSGGGE